jgi:hypothetical protein
METPAARDALLRIYLTPGLPADLRAFARAHLGVPTGDMVDASGAALDGSVIGDAPDGGAAGAP